MSRFVLVTPRVRQNAHDAISAAPGGYTVTVSEPKRSSVQGSHFHALCDDLAKSNVVHDGSRRTAGEWKILLISGHTIATDGPQGFTRGLEDELVNIRESTALMSVRRASSLIEYTIAFCVANEVELKTTRDGGFMQ